MHDIIQEEVCEQCGHPIQFRDIRESNEHDGKCEWWQCVCGNLSKEMPYVE